MVFLDSKVVFASDLIGSISTIVLPVAFQTFFNALTSSTLELSLQTFALTFSSFRNGATQSSHTFGHGWAHLVGPAITRAVKTELGLRAILANCVDLYVVDMMRFVGLAWMGAFLFIRTIMAIFPSVTDDDSWHTNICGLASELIRFALHFRAMFLVITIWALNSAITELGDWKAMSRFTGTLPAWAFVGFGGDTVGGDADLKISLHIYSLHNHFISSIICVGGVDDMKMMFVSFFVNRHTPVFCQGHRANSKKNAVFGPSNLIILYRTIN